MKVRAGTAAAAFAVGRVAAQAGYPGVSSSSAPTTSYTTVTLDECPTGSFSTYMTVTEGITVTYCPECEMGTKPPAPTTKKPGYTTVYTTTYLSLCPTGLVPATYTVTESCTDDEPTWTPGPTHIPQGFTVTEKHCSACEEGSKTVTVTEPCGCEATGGVPVPPKATNPVQQISDGQIQNPATPGSGGSGGSTPAKPTSAPAPECDGKDCGGSGNQSPPSSGGSKPPAGSDSGSTPPAASSPAACDGKDCGGDVSPPTSKTPVAPGTSAGASAPPYPTGAASSPVCPGPECGAEATGGAAGPTGGASTPTGPTESITPSPYDSGASRGFAASVVLSAVVGILAFAL